MFGFLKARTTKPTTDTDVTAYEDSTQTKRAIHVNHLDAGVISSVNSSSDTLGGSATFTGTGVDVSGMSVITVFVDSDVDGTLKMQFSSDNTNWDRTKQVPLDIEIGSGSVHTLEVVAQYFRVVYVNGSSAQGHFRLQTICHVFKSGFLTSSPDQKISKVNDAQIIRVSNDPLFDISRGLYADKYSFHRFGHNTAVPNGSLADIWSYGPSDATYNWPITAEKFRIKAGGNTADTAAGLGAQSIQRVYLDSTGVKRQQQLATAGSSASASTTNTATRLIRAWVDVAGTILSNNTASILIENESSGLIVGEIAAGQGQTEMSMYTVPLGYTAYLSRVTVDVAAGANKDADIMMWQRTNALTFAAPFGVKRIVREWDAIQGESTIEFKHLPSFAALTDLWFEGKGNGAETEIDVDYDLILVKDEAPTVPQ
jgi:hypothetical protein